MAYNIIKCTPQCVNVYFLILKIKIFQGCQIQYDYSTRPKGNLMAEKFNFSFIQENDRFNMIFNNLPERVRSFEKFKLTVVVKHYY